MIIVMGVTGAGKSYFINKLAGKDVVREGADLESCRLGLSLRPISSLMFDRHAGMSTGARIDWQQQSAIGRHTGL